MLKIGPDHFEEIKDPGSKLNIVVGERRIASRSPGEPAESTAEPNSTVELNSAAELNSPHTKR